jgi:hypothetical protein
MKKIALIFIAILTVSLAVAQPNTYILKKHFANTDVSSDTVTNTATNYLGNLTLIPGQRSSVSVIVTVTKLSGTVGGVITLQGSLDGTTFFAMNAPESQTALATKTAADASGVYHWWLKTNPFPYYRVSWVGTGTMSATMSAKILAH